MFNLSNYKTIIGKHIKGMISDILDTASNQVKEIPDDKIIPNIRKDIPIEPNIIFSSKSKNCPIYFIENRHNINNKDIYDNFSEQLKNEFKIK